MLWDNTLRETMLSLWETMQQVCEDDPIQSGMHKHAKTETKQEATPKQQGSPGNTTGKTYKQEQRDKSRNSDSVDIKYLNSNSVRLVIVTKLESSTSQIEHE